MMKPESTFITSDEKHMNSSNASSSASVHPTEKDHAETTAQEKADNDRLHSSALPPLHVIPSSCTATDHHHHHHHHETGSLERRITAVSDTTETYPEGGREAWLVVFGAWLALVSALGLMNTQATFQTYLSEHQLAHYDQGTVGWVFSIYTFVVFFMGLYTGPLFDKYGPRWIVLAGTGLVFGSLMLFSISTGKDCAHSNQSPGFPPIF